METDDLGEERELNEKMRGRMEVQQAERYEVIRIL